MGTKSSAEDSGLFMGKDTCLPPTLEPGTQLSFSNISSGGRTWRGGGEASARIAPGDRRGADYEWSSCWHVTGM